MKYIKQTRLLFLSLITAWLVNSCTTKIVEKADPLSANIKMYTQVWDSIINHGKLELFNESNFTKDLVMHEGTVDVVGIEKAKEYYSNYLKGFSNISFAIKDVFGQGDKLVKYWNFTGTHTGEFFSIPATGKGVSVEGVTLVRMKNGKIAEERDILDNLEFMQQLGLIAR